MTTLVVGASGATGRLVLTQLLDRGEKVKAIIRSNSRLPESVSNHENLSVLNAAILNLGEDQLAEVVKGCDAVVSCLGHNLTLKGIYGAPRKLVTDAVRRLCDAIIQNQPTNSVKFVLMNTAGNGNRDIPETTSISHKIVIGILRLLLPPHVDNEKAADYLRTQVGQSHDDIEWVVVRPDGLINKTEVTGYTEHPSPVRDAIFNAGQTSRINVAHFIAELILNDNKWNKWIGKMPVIYNLETE